MEIRDISVLEVFNFNDFWVFKSTKSADQCASIGWASFGPQGSLFDSGQGTCLGCGFGPWVGVQMRGNQSVFLALMFLSLSFSLPSISKNK